MNEKQIRQQVVDLARSWLGRVQGDAGHKEIIDLYNSYTPHPRGYKMTYTDPWCAATVSALGIKLGLTDIMPVECSCSKLIELYKAHPDSRWEENDAYVPNLGDLVFYDWDDTGAGDNTGGPEHVGVVVSVSATTISVIEGNYSKAVKLRKIPTNGRYIRGFGLPSYHKHATADADFAGRVIASARSYGVISADVDAKAPATVEDVLVMFKRAIDTGWLIDGAPLPVEPPAPPVVQPVERPELKKGIVGAAVKQLQTRLNYLGYGCGEVDGDFGPKTEDAVRRFQTAAKIGVDGIVGPQTWTALDTAKPTGLLLELRPTDIKRIEYVHGLEPVESIESAYKRIGCDIITNANFFGLSSGNPTGYLMDEGRTLSAGLLSKWGFEFVKKQRPVFKHWDELRTGDDFLGGYPCLLRDGKVSIDTTEAGFSAASTDPNVYRRGRTAIGIKPDGTFVIRCVADNDANRFTVPELAECMIAIGCVNAINLDGGGSTSWITKEGRFISRRMLDGFLAVWLN